MRARSWNKKWAIRLAVAFVLLLVSVWVYGRTIVTKTGPCEVTVECNIAIWGPNATQAVADRWQKTISAKYNGPSSQLIDHIAKANGLKPGVKPDEDPNDDFKKAKKLAEDFLKEIGMDSAYVNCCKVKFKIKVKLQSKIAADDKTDYHKVKVVPQFSTITKADGTTERVEFRDFVRVPGGDLSKTHKQSTTGEWADRTGSWAAEAHETGHMMGLDDQYTEDAAGCHTVPGHETDVMNYNWGAPFEAAIARIVQLGGVKCNCCTSLDDAWVKFGQTWRPATDACLTCNEDILKQALADVNDQLKNIGHYSASLQQRYDLYKRLKDLQKRLQKALEDCEKKEAVSTGGLGLTDGLLNGGRFSFDSSTFCNFWGGGISIPPSLLEPLGPAEPSGPLVTPSAPLTTPLDTSGPPETTVPKTPTGTPPPVTTPLSPTIALYPELLPPILTLPPEGPGAPTSVGKPTPTTPPVVPSKPVVPSSPPRRPPGAKVYESVFNNQGKLVLKPMSGARVKADLFAVPPLPVAGSKRPTQKDGGNKFRGEPFTGFTNKAGTIAFGRKKQAAKTTQTVPLLAAVSKKLSPKAVLADIAPLSASNAKAQFAGESELDQVKVVIPKIRSYIVKLKLNRSLKNWNRPVAYLTDKKLKPYIKRHWIVEDSMYMVFNFPVVEGD